MKMHWTDKLSLRHKLTVLIMINTFVALCVAAVGFAEYGIHQFKQQRVEDLNALANILGTNCTAALVFQDPKAAQDTLKGLAAKPHILAAAIYDRDGRQFAVYRGVNPSGNYAAPPVEPDSIRVTSDRVTIFQGIVFDGDKMGTVLLEGDNVEYTRLLTEYLLFFGLIVAAVSLGSYGLAAFLQRPISTPILELAWTAKMVTSSRDYSIRAAKTSRDEVGVLIDGFNEMLGQIQSRDNELLETREDLERRVDERTAELEQEVADRQRAQEALHESEGRIRLLLDSTAEAIFGVDRDGKFTFCNPATLRLLGYQSAEELLGKNAHTTMHYAHPDGTHYPMEECPLVPARQGREIHTDAEVFWRSDGSSFPAELWAYPIRKEGEVIGAVVTFLEITERKRNEAALRNAKEAAEAGSRAKSEFLANMSHEIRTPMNGIIGMTELALDTPLSDEQRDYLGLVKSSADSLLRIINDILDFSKIEAGKLELEKTEFHIRDMFRDTLKALAQRADKKKLEMCERVSPGVPRTLIGDPTRLRQLVVNLIGNAIKFTEEGTIVLDTELETTTGEEVRLHVIVSDTGMGIPADKQQLIFDSFAQADGSTTRRFGGTGLGLTISRQLAELMGGRIWVESEVGKGSKFHFTCVFHLGTAAASPHEQIAGTALPGMNVLVVDNNEISRGIFAEMLKNWGMNATLAEDGRRALDILENSKNNGRPFPIVLLDAAMPGIDGFQVLQRIQGNPGLAGTVVMLLSANRQSVDAKRCQRLGVMHYLTKPVGQSELLDAILLVLGHTVAEEQMIELPAPDVEKDPARMLNVLLAEDNVVNQKLAIRLLEKAGHRVTLAATGRQAIAAWECSGDRGFDLVLMDIQMPELDGMEATAEIRQREKESGRHVPILAMTAHAMRGDKERCLASGMDGYVSKPIHPASLFAEIDRCLALCGERDAMLENSRERPEQIDRASLLERVEGDQELLAEMVHLFQDDAPNLLTTMRDALRRGDMVVLERSAHSLKGAVSNLSANVTAAAALQLEIDAKKGDAASAKESLAKVERAVQRLLPALADLCQGVSK